MLMFVFDYLETTFHISVITLLNLKLQLAREW